MSLKTLKRNAFHNVLGWLVPTAIFLLLTPYMIHELGIEGFGIVSLIQIITGYMNMLNFGFSEAIIKQVAESLEQDRNRLMQVMWAGLGLFAGFGALGGVVLYALADWLGKDILQVSAALKDDTAAALRVGAWVFFLQMLAEYYRGVSLGCQRFDVPNISRILRISLSGIFIVVALENGAGLEGVMWATLAGLLVGLVVNAVWMQRIMPLAKAHGSLRHVLLDIYHFSKHIFLTRVANIVSSKISQFFLGTLSSAANVALFEVPTRVAETGSVILNRILQVLFPKFASMDRVRDIGRIREMYVSVLQIQLAISIPLMMIIIMEGPYFLEIWIDKGFSDSASSVITLVAVTYFLSSLTNLPVFTAMSFNLPGIISKYSFIRMGITAVVVYPLVSTYGLMGAAWTLFLSELQGLFLVHESSRRALQINVFRVLARPIRTHLILTVLVWVLYEMAYRGSAWYHPLAVLAVFPVYAGAALLLGATSERDNQRILRLVSLWH